MEREPIPDDTTRFILTCISSIPHLEALLLLRNAPGHGWNGKQVAQRLYISEKAANELLLNLHAAGFLSSVNEQAASLYSYSPATDELRQMIDRLAEIYSKNIVEVSNLIHSGMNNKAQQFADAFKWRKDS